MSLKFCQRINRSIEKGAIEPAEQAVSPVVGVVLMVALTVVLAGVIGVFAFGIGDQLRPADPTTSLEISGDVDNNGMLNATIEHEAGVRLATDDLTLAIREDGATLETFDVEALDESYYGPDKWRSGETIEIVEFELDTTDIDASSELTLAIQYDPSESVVESSSIDNHLAE